MINFLKETKAILKENGKKSSDVIFVTDGCNMCSFKDFCDVSDFDYDDGYGSNFINMSLKIVGEGWWLERREYDGSEWWVYCTPPSITNEGHVRITDGYYLDKQKYANCTLGTL